MLDLLSFDEWWLDFIHDPSFEKDQDTAIRRLRSYIGQLGSDQRSVFFLSLADVVVTRGSGSWVALSALEYEADDAVCARLLRFLRNDESSGKPDDGYHAAILRVLARCNGAECKSEVRIALLKDPIGTFWSSVPWALWPQDRVLFAEAWARYFRLIPESLWRNTVIVQAFLSCAEGLGAVREVLETSDIAAWKRLRAALLEETAPWLSTKQRADLLQACGHDG